MSSERRPVIPAELRRRVLLEAGHRCAIPTCRHIDVDIHHIIAWEQCKKHEYENLIALCPNCHRQAKQGRIDKKSLRKYKVSLRFAMDKYSRYELDILFDLSKDKSNKGMPFFAYNALLIKRLLDSDFVRIVEPERLTAQFVGLYYHGKECHIKLTPDLLVITDRGRKFIQSLGIQEID